MMALPSLDRYGSNGIVSVFLRIVQSDYYRKEVDGNRLPAQRLNIAGTLDRLATTCNARRAWDNWSLLDEG